MLLHQDWAQCSCWCPESAISWAYKTMTNQWNAAEYDAKHAFVYEKARGLVELLAPKAAERILDLGCGTGALTAEIAGRGAEVLGVDRSEEMITQARKKFPALRFEVLEDRKSTR